MRVAFIYAMWIVQVVCLATILWTAWIVLDTPLFAMAASSIVLAVTLYLEQVFPLEEE
jgi:hypothetical protein